MFCKNTFLAIIQHNNSKKREGEIVTIFHIWFPAGLVTLIMDARLKLLVLSESLFSATRVNKCSCIYLLLNLRDNSMDAQQRTTKTRLYKFKSNRFQSLASDNLCLDPQFRWRDKAETCLHTTNRGSFY